MNSGLEGGEGPAWFSRFRNMALCSPVEGASMENLGKGMGGGGGPCYEKGARAPHQRKGGERRGSCVRWVPLKLVYPLTTFPTGDLRFLPGPLIFHQSLMKRGERAWELGGGGTKPPGRGDMGRFKSLRLENRIEVLTKIGKRFTCFGVNGGE